MHPWRDRLGRWLTPLARRTPLSPNAISILAFLLNVAAAALLLNRGFLPAVILIAIAGLGDALDGIAARVQQKESRFGDFLDHCLDRLSDTLLALGWLMGNHVRESIVITALIIIMITGYIGTQIEATYRERSYELMGRGEFVLLLIVFPIVSSILFTNGWEARTIGTLTVAEWLAAFLIAFGLLGILQRFALARRLDRA